MSWRWKALFEPPTLNDRVVEILCDALTQIDLDYLRHHPETPPIYRSGVRYIREPFRQPCGDHWRAIPWVIEAGGGDCEDLACWRAAELIAGGKKARPIWSKKQHPGPPGVGLGVLYHILVELPCGEIEDPSKVLGMR